MKVHLPPNTGQTIFIHTPFLCPPHFRGARPPGRAKSDARVRHTEKANGPKPTPGPCGSVNERSMDILYFCASCNARYNPAVPENAGVKTAAAKPLLDHLLEKRYAII